MTCRHCQQPIRACTRTKSRGFLHASGDCKGWVHSVDGSEGKLQPCGTAAAARRHWRRGEKPCDECLQAARREKADKMGHDPGGQSISRRALRNGLPITPGYSYQARTYPWAQRVLAAAEAVYGTPEDTPLAGGPGGGAR